MIAKQADEMNSCEPRPKRWSVIICWSLAAYCFGPVLFGSLLNRFDAWDRFGNFFFTVFAPLEWCYRHSPAVAALYDSAHRMIGFIGL